MKILKDNYVGNKNANIGNVRIEPYPRKLICEDCGSELEYEISDMRMGALGCMYVDCPLCGYDNMIEENEQSITLTMDNVEFPTHFFHTSKDGGAVDCCNNEEVKDAIRRGIDYLRKNADDFNWYTCHGNLFVEVQRYDGDENYWVIVTNNYYDTYIPFESADYKK